MTSKTNLHNPDQFSQVFCTPDTWSLLTEEHQAQIEARGIHRAWAAANCMSCDIPKASVMLGYSAKSAGIMLMSDQYGQWQFRPDEPWASKDGKTPKYRTGKGEYDAFLAKHPTINAYWSDLEALKARCFTIDGKPWLLITEGGFKGITGCQSDIPTIGLVGVTMGLTPKSKGEPDLIAALKRLAEAGFGFIIAFDADEKPNKNVATAESKLAKALLSYGCAVRTVTGHWEHEDGKGMDDFIQKNGIEAFRAILMKAESYSIEPRVSGDRKQGKELPPPSAIAEELAETYRDKLAWESEYQLWRRYGAKRDGVWDIETVESVRGLIHTHLRSKGVPGFNSGYVSSIATILQSDLEVLDWNEQAGLIPLRDGVLDQLTQKLKPHAPGYRFTWQLPFKWADRAVGCQPIEEFLLKITGNQSIADVLMAYLAAIVTRRADLQRYLELIGGGGTGKSTFMALARALTGSDNAVSSQLKHLENNQFETAKFYGKILGLFPDSERWQGEVSVLKQLTGQDPIRYERKGVQQCRDFVFKGMVILSANEAPESRDLTSGQERRKLTIHLDTRLPEYEGRNLIQEFEPYLPGLLRRVLDIPVSEVTRLIKHTDREVPALAQVKWKQLCETNPIAGWLEEKAVINPDVKGYVGLGDMEQAGRWLYANFCKYQQENGHKNTVSMKRFSLNLRDLLKNQMKVAIVEGRDRDGSYIKGVGLRCQLDPAGELYPCPVTKKRLCDGFSADCDGSVTVESLTGVGFDGYAGFYQNSNDRKNKISSTPPPDKLCAVDGEKKESKLSNPTPASVPANTNPSNNHHESVTNPSPEPVAPKQHREFEIKQRVIITEHACRLHKGAVGEIVGKTYLGRSHTKYHVQLDKKSHGQRLVAVEIPIDVDGLTYLMMEPKHSKP